MRRVWFLLLFLLYGCGGGSSDSEKYYLHKDITVTNFYVGELASDENGYIPNVASAWDDIWMWHYGGIDTPDERNQSYVYYPKLFKPTENPFYFALPYNDLDDDGNPKSTQKEIPWYTSETNASILKNRWIKIIKHFSDGSEKVAYAQWEDVGPFGEDDFDYVFGSAKPANTINNNAGLDVSPAVKLYLGLSDIDKIDWQFVDASDVPEGPWKNILTNTPVTFLDFAEVNVSTTWYWQLQGSLRDDIPAKVYDVDLFDTSTDTISNLKKEGKIVICYINAGAWEDWRDDADDFPDSVFGNDLDGWDGEKWLDIRSDTVKDLMMKRFDLARQKGCDGIEPDNIDGYENDTGFNLTYQDQFNYNRFLAIEAKKRGLLIGLKNDLDQVGDLVEYFDFAVNESCHEYNECDKLKPFTDQNKPVFNAEYNQSYVDDNDSFNALCEDAKNRNFRTIVLPIDLNGSFVRSCDYGDY